MNHQISLVSARRSFFAFLAFVLAGCWTLGQPATRFAQDRFVIGYWVGPQTSENLRARYQEIADANFTLVIGSNGMDIARQLDLCREFGLKAIVDAQGVSLPVNDACWGFALKDEPNAADFADLAKRAEEVRARQPGKFGYINLFPNYASSAQLGTATYEEHVEKFVREVKPEVLSMDHYPLIRPESDSRDSYLANLSVMRKYSLEAGIPFWNFFYSMPFNDRLDPTEAQIRWQIFASIAYGAKGVLYFCYWTPGKGAGGAGEFPKGGAIITAEGLKTRHYDEARRINGELKKLGPELMKLTSVRIERISNGKDTRAALSGTPLRNLSRVSGDPAGEFLIGTFARPDGWRAVLILNHNYSFTAWPTLEFDAEASRVMEVSKITGETAAVVDDSPELKGLQISLGAGDARLFLVPPATSPGKSGAADQPAPRTDSNSQLAHEQLLEKAAKGGIDIYFVGDSITRRWGASDPQYKHLLENWNANFFGWNAADFGWGADRTQNILWRLENGELDGVNPKIIVLQAGTNNLGPGSGGDAKVEDVTHGLKAILDVCRAKAPKAVVILTGIFPRNDNMAAIPIINRINKNLAQFADGKTVRYLDVNDRLADKDGRLFEGMMNPDKLHPAVKGYQIWADGLKPIFTELLGPPAKTDHAPPPTGDPSAMRKAPTTTQPGSAPPR